MNFFKRLFTSKSKTKQKFVYTTQNLARITANGRLVERGNSLPASVVSGNFSSADNFANRILVNSNVQSYFLPDESNALGPETKSQKPITDTRPVIEPRQVFGEIKVSTPEVSFEDLDEKIKVVEERIAILREHVEEARLGDEYKTLFFLKNRKRYLKTRKRNSIDWAVTTPEAVDNLCSKYRLKVVPLKQFYTLVPKEGLKEMDRYTRAYKAVTGDTPIFELVVKDSIQDDEERKKKDRDPIILANSPFGNHMMIIGVWDDEVEVVDEIIYHGK